MLETKANQRLREANQIDVLFDELPIEPGNRVVLAIGIVVAALSPPAFVAGKEHRHALAEQQRGENVANLAVSQAFDFFASGGPFEAVVAAVVVIVAVAIAFAVGLVVLVVVADQIAQRKTIVRGDEVDAVTRLTAAGLV